MLTTSSLFAFGDANLLWSIDDSCVVAELQRSNDSSGQREQQVACYLLVLLRKGGVVRERGQVAQQKVETWVKGRGQRERRKTR